MNRLIVLCAVVMLLFAASVSAQVDVATATLKGSVTDPAGAVVPGANVTAISTERGVSKTAVSDASGPSICAARVSRNPAAVKSAESPGTTNAAEPATR